MAGSVGELAERLIAGARDGEQLEVYIGHAKRFTARAYDGAIESITSAETAGVGVRVIVGSGRQGFAHAGSIDPSVLDDVLTQARDNAEFAEADPFAGLVSPDGVSPPELDGLLYVPSMTAVAPERKADLAIELERAVRASDPRIKGVRTSAYSDGIVEVAIRSTAGISVTSAYTSCSLSTSALAEDGERTQTGYGVDVARAIDQLDLERCAREASERATRMIGSGPVPSRRLTAVFEPRVASAIVAIAAGMLCGDRVVKRRTPFADRLGDQIASPLLTLADDATDARSLGAGTHDAEGLATRRTALVVGGELRQFLHNGYSARRAGAESTASAVRGYASTPGVGALALIPQPGHGTLAELCARVGDGLLVSGMNGLHSGVNAVSGDFSVGVEGLLIHDGVPGRPVREVTVASTMQRLLSDIVAVGGELEWQPGGDAAVALVIEGISLSGL